MTRCEKCDRDRLQYLFNETLSEKVANEVADHVADCIQCQQELELLAAEKEWWREASLRLSQSSLVAVFPGTAGIDRTSSQHPQAEWKSSDAGLDDSSDEAYVSDFAVDFLDPSDDSSVLGRLGEYEIVEVIGRGGMGIVLKGFQKELHRFVAVKVLAPYLATSGAARRRFAREAQATAAVVNPHVMAIHSVHANSKLPYLVMPYVECESLQQRLDRLGPLELKDVLRIGMQAALGLAAAHAQGLVHRDVKPANILLETNVDRVMLTDFGLARAVDDATLTRTGIIAGTPQYMSPEQANGDAVDHRSDIFSLGSVLYAMCTARPPFRAETTFGILRRIRETDPRLIREINPDIPAWLERIVFNLLAKNSESRIGTATEVAKLLEQCLAHVQQPTIAMLPSEWTNAPAVPAGDAAQRKKSRSSVIRYAMLIVTTVAMIVGSMAWFGRATPFRIRNANSNAVSFEHSEQKPESSTTTETHDSLFDWNETQFELGDVDQSLKRLENAVEAGMDSQSLHRELPTNESSIEDGRPE
jgi:serine/threonine protein kinase